MPSFKCSSCGKAIRWEYILGYGYGFIHVTGPEVTCLRPKHPEPEEQEEEPPPPRQQ